MDRGQVRNEIVERVYKGSSSEATDGAGPRHFLLEDLSLEFDREVVNSVVIEAERLGVTSLSLVAFALEKGALQSVNELIKELNSDNT
jgi:hypothetical protein